MKILLLTTHLDPGGISAYVVNLARHLKKNGVDVAIVSSGGGFEERLSKENIPHFGLNIRTKAEFGVKVWKSLPRLIRLIKENGFEIIHAQTRVTQVMGHIAGKITGIPLITTCHGFFGPGKLFRRIFPCWGMRAIAISDSVREHLIKDFHVDQDRVRQIYNGIETEDYLTVNDVKDKDVLRDTGMDGGKNIIGSIGRLSSVKGYKHLISAFADVEKKHSDVLLLIVGEGGEKDALEKQISEAGLSNKVFLTTPSATLDNYLSVMDIFCLPSINEGLGLSLMEAMAAGRPCIGSDVGGISEIISDFEDGILVPPGDAQAISGAILRLIEDPGLREKLGESARNKAQLKFSMTDSTKKTMEIYREVVENCK